MKCTEPDLCVCVMMMMIMMIHTDWPSKLPDFSPLKLVNFSLLKGILCFSHYLSVKGNENFIYSMSINEYVQYYAAYCCNWSSRLQQSARIS